MMHVDESKYKVYVYDLDDELSSESEPEDGKLVFLPDIEKHLNLNRIPPSVLANSDGELAGMQLVLYSDSEPHSLTVPEDKDSVRKAILESRARLREQQKAEQPISRPRAPSLRSMAVQDQRLPYSAPLSTSFGRPVYAREASPVPTRWPAAPQDDPDAMELD
jgi:hypothetical protein